jgi:hypothetical protein
METLIQRGVLQYETFGSIVCEVIDGNIRFVLRRNPIRAQEIQENREEKKESIEDLVKEKNQYLKIHRKAKEATALKSIKEKIESLKVKSWLSVRVVDRELILDIDENALAEEQLLDGCYVIKTDLLQEECDTQTVHSRYKDLALVESAFRTSKSILELRPVHVRKKVSTYAHVLVVMLAYKIIRHLDREWASLYLTVEEGLRSLSTLTWQDVSIKDGSAFQQIPEPRAQNKKMLEVLGIELPKILPKSSARVVTRKTRRKSSLIS